VFVKNWITLKSSHHLPPHASQQLQRTPPSVFICCPNTLAKKINNSALKTFTVDVAEKAQLMIFFQFEENLLRL
jgi:hypothetical protein